MARSKGGQSNHDAKVKQMAKQLQELGYDVKADISGFPKPETVGGYRPDVVGTKGETRKIIEVETPDSVNSARDAEQQKAFQQAANRSKNTDFKRVIIKKK